MFKKLTACCSLAVILSCVIAPVAMSAEQTKALRSSLKMQFVMSEPCSLLAFFDALSGRPHSTAWIRSWFDQSKATKLFVTESGASLPLTELYEGMATALCQGWFNQVALGANKDNWYNDRLINAYSHKIYPLVKRYMDQHLAMDKELLYRTLPRLRELSISAPFTDGESIRTFSKYQGKHAAIPVKRSDLKDLSTIGLAPQMVTDNNLTEKGKKRTLVVKAGERETVFCVAITRGAKNDAL